MWVVDKNPIVVLVFIIVTYSWKYYLAVQLIGKTDVDLIHHLSIRDASLFS